MKLQRVFGNTYFIKGGTNTGVYLFENKNALGYKHSESQRGIKEGEKNGQQNERQNQD